MLGESLVSVYAARAGLRPSPAGVWNGWHGQRPAKAGCGLLEPIPHCSGRSPTESRWRYGMVGTVRDRPKRAVGCSGWSLTARAGLRPSPAASVMMARSETGQCVRPVVRAGLRPCLPVHHSIAVSVTSDCPEPSISQYAADENRQWVGSVTSPLRRGLSCR